MKIQYPITFLYYKDLDTVVPFYRDILGLILARDQGWCKIFSINGMSYVGLVDEAVGSMRMTEEKSVLLTLVVDDVDAWYDHVRAHNVQVLGTPTLHEEIGVYCFFLKDPAGYTLEIQRFVDDL